MNIRTIILAASALIMSAAVNAQTVVTVFIHGTIAPGAVVFSPIGLAKQKLGKNTLYGKIADKTRKDLGMREDWPLPDEGMIEITPEILEQYHAMTLDKSLGKFAAYQLVGAYNYFEKNLNPNNDYRYFFFGYNGLLDETERVEAGKALYKELVNIRKQYDSEAPIFNIVGHSHGGTVGLYTDYGVREKNDPEISINDLIMLGTPLQKGQEHLIASPFFNRIFNIYSLGDAMQKK
ncbi:MAG: hypothetical protein ABUL44_04725, partial [Flavobacterium sp.]